MNPLKKIHVTSPYGPRRHPVTGKSNSFHNGTDLRAKYVETYAIANGTVRLVRTWEPGIGKYVVIDHDGFTTIYGHLSEFKVKQGQKVGEGELIAITGNSGASTAPHLHFEMRSGNPSRLWDKNSKGVYTNSFDPIPFLADKKEEKLDFETLYYELAEKLEKIKEIL